MQRYDMGKYGRQRIHDLILCIVAILWIAEKISTENCQHNHIHPLVHSSIELDIKPFKEISRICIDIYYLSPKATKNQARPMYTQ
jgi:hypothetical protein